MEKWKPFPHPAYEDDYEVSSLGAVRRRTAGHATWAGRILSPYVVSGRYLAIRISRGGSKRSFLIHRLVAEAFIPKPQGKTVINHIDGCGFNNFVSNLEWCTQAENESHAVRSGLKARGERHHMTTLTAGQVGVIKARLLAGESGSALAREYGVSQPTISAIKVGRNWGHIPPTTQS